MNGTARKFVFPSLLAQLWNVSFKPDHCKGVVPFLWKHILLKITLLGTAARSKEDASTNSVVHSTTDHIQGESSQLKCTGCGHEMAATPISKSGTITAHPSEILKAHKARSGSWSAVRGVHGVAWGGGNHIR